MSGKLLLGSVKFTISTPSDAIQDLLGVAAASRSEGIAVHFANAYTVALARKDRAYRQLLNAATFVFPDGRPVAWMSRLMHRSPQLRQVRGPQLFKDVFAASQHGTIRHYLLGSTPEVIEKLASNLTRDYPGATIVGQNSPPFRPLTDEELAVQDDAIQSSGADIVWVGLGTPKQDLEVSRLAKSLPIVAVAIGAAFDFSAGTKREAPAWLSPLGLEWTFRLITEPRRLWRRYLFGNVGFILACLEQFRLGARGKN
ncbi:WecB/TagA/CpsF family glycosyltransferase [Arthrobacter sp. Soc17.1.1.1]|uniref:WecB/TagA/CpsF family glycosyltransferase n=1 Tax=Arthrobacter sp. Soc17.1.1.1 TaxID=3121277 RepID=UPI002FE492C0